jgi:hypothetical protein
MNIKLKILVIRETNAFDFFTYLPTISIFARQGAKAKEREGRLGLTSPSRSRTFEMHL